MKKKTGKYVEFGARKFRGKKQQAWVDFQTALAELCLECGEVTRQEAILKMMGHQMPFDFGKEYCKSRERVRLLFEKALAGVKS